MSRKLQNDLEFIFNTTSILVDGFVGKTIFFTGGTGFIGKWILEYLFYLNQNKNLKFQIIVLSRNPEVFLEQFPKYNNSFIQFIKGDIRDFNFEQLTYSDFIIHAATDADAKLNHEDPLKMIDIIVDGTRNVLEYGVRVKAKKILFLSSGAVYGVQPEDVSGFTEDYTGGPDILSTSSAYSEAKRLAELLCACYIRQYSLNISIARCFAFVGPYLPLDKHFAIGNFIGNGLKKENIVIRGNGKPLRSYMYSSELIVWLLFILFKGQNGQAYNVGSDRPISISDLARLVSTFFPLTKVVILNQVAVTDRNQNYIPDISKMKQELGLELTIDLETALSKTINYYK